MLSVIGLYSVDDKMINEFRAFGGMIIGRGTQVIGENQPQCPTNST
jgi:hypothetical protein